MELNAKQNLDIAETLDTGRVSERRRRLKKWLIVFFLLVIGAVTAVLVLRPGKGTDGTQHRTQAARKGDIVVTVTATGNLEPTNQVDVGSELSGTARSVEVDFNDRVTVSQVLAKLDTSKLEAQNLQLKAALASAEATVMLARATVKEADSNLARLKRVRELSGDKVPSQFELDAAEAALERARAEEARACLLYTSPSPRDRTRSRMPSSA